MFKSLFRSHLRAAIIRRWKKGRTIRVLGFTLVELLIVVAIMSTLAAIAIYHYRLLIEQTEEIRAKSDIETIAKLIDAFKEANDRYPDSLAELEGGPFVEEGHMGCGTLG